MPRGIRNCLPFDNVLMNFAECDPNDYELSMKNIFVQKNIQVDISNLHTVENIICPREVEHHIRNINLHSRAIWEEIQEYAR